MYITFYKNRNRSLWKSKELNRILKRIRKSRPIYIQAFASMSVNICTLCRKVKWSCSCLAAGAEGALTTKKPSCGSELMKLPQLRFTVSVTFRLTTPLPFLPQIGYLLRFYKHFNTLLVFFWKRSTPYRSECKI